MSRPLLISLVTSSLFKSAHGLPLAEPFRYSQSPRTFSKGSRTLESTLRAKSSRSLEPIHPGGAVGPNSNSPRLFLFAVPVVWGTYTCAVKFVYQSAEQPPPTVLFNFLTYSVSLATLLTAKALQRARSSTELKTTTAKEDPPKTWAAGAELGFYLFLGSNLQVTGIQRTSAACAAALVQLSAVFVPFIEAVVYRRPPSRRLWLASALSVAGVAAFTGIFCQSAGLASGAGGTATVLGDMLVLSAAACYSLHILRLSALASRIGNSAGSLLRLAVAKSATEVVLAAGAVLFGLWRGDEKLCSWMATFLGSISPYAGAHAEGIDALALGSLAAVALWNGAAVTAFPMWAQAVGQQRVGASEAALIYATQPVWAVAFAAALLHEKPLGRELAGGALLLIAIGLALTSNRTKNSTITNVT